MLLAAPALNHLLAQNAWARDRLAAHAGKIFQLRVPPVMVNFTIGEDGLLTQAATDAPIGAALFALPGTLARYALITPRDPSLITIEGDVEFGALLRDTLAQLKWEAEEDLSKVVGDVLAHRIAGFARDMLAWRLNAATSVAHSAAEYVTEERPLIAKHRHVEQFTQDVAATTQAVDALEQRIEKLKTRFLHE